MTKPQSPVFPDLMDGLIQAPMLEQEIAKLGAWLLKQEVRALQDLPVSALGELAEYVKGRVHEDRCERFIQSHSEESKDPNYPVPGAVVERPLPIPVGGLETMWPQAPEAQQVPELDIPRPAV